MDYDSYDAVLHWLFRATQGDSWFKPSEENVSAGVCLRVEPGQFRIFPYENRYLVPFEAAIRVLNPLVAIKVRSAAVHAALASVADDVSAIYVDHDTRIQVLDTMSHLPRADKEQCGAFIRDERVLVVWSDELDSVVTTCSDFEEKLMKLVWRSRPKPASRPTVTSVVTTPSQPASGPPSTEAIDEKAQGAVTDEAAAAMLVEKSKPKKKRQLNFG